MKKMGKNAKKFQYNFVIRMRKVTTSRWKINSSIFFYERITDAELNCCVDRIEITFSSGNTFFPVAAAASTGRETTTSLLKRFCPFGRFIVAAAVYVTRAIRADSYFYPLLAASLHFSMHRRTL